MPQIPRSDSNLTAGVPLLGIFGDDQCNIPRNLNNLDNLTQSQIKMGVPKVFTNRERCYIGNNDNHKMDSLNSL